MNTPIFNCRPCGEPVYPVDEIVFKPHCATAENYPQSLDLRPYVGMAAGKVRIYGNLWRYGSPVAAEVMADDLYRQGVDGIAFYESNQAVETPGLRENIWRFSRPECLRYQRKDPV